ncbi:hypothetical protein TGAMA5MH_00920 [Trichoderma gamsii]|uniref:Major facilitator superfamily transporter n=1 Tax=Trichoderma gamsii TaxID=398673 RepID=A0A2K0TQQ7_9HYPO|nr:hypothetical protein TGAMA5MH_00920 [Trichoderma gamsii]
MEQAEHVSNPTPMAALPEREIEVDLVPGTEVMANMDGVSFYRDSNNQDTVALIPQPTNDPHDPLNWTTLWKTLVIVNQGIFVIASVIPTMSIAPLTPIFMQQWQTSLADVALLATATSSLSLVVRYWDDEQPFLDARY